MKKLLLFAAFCFVGSLFAEEAKAAMSYKDYPVSYLQLGIWYNFPRSQMESNTVGIKSGWPMCAGTGSVTGLEASWLGSLTQHIDGAQLGWTVCYCYDLKGLQATLITCINTDHLTGLQASPVFNMAGDVTGVQASSVNVARNFTGFQPAAILNVADDFKGFQAAPIMNIADNVDGMQASLLNKAKKVGFQLGLLNMATDGFQIGLLNFMDNAWLPCFPLVNFTCGK
ncbi:MAG: hypothetical protein MJ016_00425 [Victivallaceae bacterium]|nr:hypothetical protein [Victivallaceae bacterium]